MLKTAYRIIPELNLVVFVHHGHATIENWIEMKKKILSVEKQLSNLKYFEDYRELIFDVSKADIERYIEFALEFEKHTSKSAFLTKTPNQVSTTEIFRIIKGEKLGKPKVVSTVQEALKWLEVKKESHQIFVQVLDELKLEVEEDKVILLPNSIS